MITSWTCFEAHGLRNAALKNVECGACLGFSFEHRVVHKSQIWSDLISY